MTFPQYEASLTSPSERIVYLYIRYKECEGEFEYTHPLELTDVSLARVLPAGGETEQPISVNNIRTKMQNISY